ncbi:hypothetical protein NA57DRAFT_29693, partial [Rhizodiscina lignyota]
WQGNARTTGIMAVVKANNLKVELVQTNPANGLSSDYLAMNKLGRVPTFEGNDGYVLTESMAIAIYLTSQNEKTTLLGKTKKDYASILRWMSFSNTELLPALGGWFRPLVGRDPYNKKSVEDHRITALKNIKVLEEHFLVNTYFVGERLTLADLYVVSQVYRGYQYVLDKKFREEHPNVTRWYETVYNQDIYKSVAPKFEMCEEAVKYTPPKKEAAPKKAEAPKKEAPKKKEAEDEEEEEDKPAPKPKHPLEALPRATFVLDDWKRKYSNEETREVALPWFWENMKWDEYSIWRVDYKYNEELTMTFMTSNLIVGGFFARLEASRKYLFGACSVYGVANDSVVRGAFVVRGQEALPAFDVAPDWESYEFTKLDPTKAEDKTFVDDMWAWDKPIEVNGKTYEWADGKGSGGGPSEDNVTGFLVRSTAANWSKGSILAVDAGSHLAAITRILEKDFSAEFSKVENNHVTGSGELAHSPENLSGSPSSSPPSGTESPAFSRASTPPITITTLSTGPFAGVPFPYATASANAAHIVREHVSTYLITHPHLDHLSGFAINTAAFHNTSRPKRLAALPFTVNAIKTHIFNDLIWPNLTDEDGGVGFVTFQRLTEGGNIALGEGHGRGFIEVCDGLSVRAFKVSHGRCTMGFPPPSGYRRSSGGNIPEAATPVHHGHSHSHSQTISYNGVGAGGAPQPLGTPRDPGRRGSLYSQPSQPGTPTWAPEHTQPVVDSSAFFIRAEAPYLTVAYTPRSTEILVFGDVEPDSVSLSPRTSFVWGEAAPKIAAGILKGIFIECSYTDAQADAVLFGHLAPRHVIAELVALSELVEKERKELQREREESKKERAARKRKRISVGVIEMGNDSSAGLAPPGEYVRTDDVEKGHRSRRRTSKTPNLPIDESMTDIPAEASTPLPPPQSLPISTMTSPTLPRRASVNVATVGGGGGSLRGLKVVIIHVKDSLSDGPPTGDVILQELRAHETRLMSQGKGLGCDFEVSKSGNSYWF